MIKLLNAIANLEPEEGMNPAQTAARRILCLLG
jgi:hypothetical protein